MRTEKRGRWDPKRLVRSVRSNPGFRLQEKKLIKNFPHVVEPHLTPVRRLHKHDAGGLAV